MSLFWRILVAFVFTVSATFLSQRWVGASESRLPTLPLLTMAGSPLVEATGELALVDIEHGDRASALRKLRPIEDSGIEAWIVTEQGALGAHKVDPDRFSSAESFLKTGQVETLPLGYRMIKLKAAGILVLLVPGFNSTPHLFWRVFLLVAIPVAIGLWLARRLASPIEQIGAAANRMASGDLTARAGNLKGPKEIQSLGAAFDKMASQVQQTLDAQNRLLIDVSHETRSPLTRIRLAAKMLSEGKGTVEGNASRIERDVFRLDELVGTLSTIVRPETAIDRSQSVNLLSLLEEVMLGLTVEAEVKGIELKLNLAEATVTGNAALISSAFENIIRNAIIYSPMASEIEIILSTDPLILQVQDRGPGVPFDELEKIFEPFYRQAEARERDSGGTGLGLAIASRAMSLHSGKAFAEPRNGGGLIVTLEFGVHPLKGAVS